MTGLAGCEHPDIRTSPLSERTAIACFKCGRLFGYLYEDEVFVAFNPTYAKEGAL